MFVLEGRQSVQVELRDFPRGGTTLRVKHLVCPDVCSKGRGLAKYISQKKFERLLKFSFFCE